MSYRQAKRNRNEATSLCPHIPKAKLWFAEEKPFEELWGSCCPWRKTVSAGDQACVLRVSLRSECWVGFSLIAWTRRFRHRGYVCLNDNPGSAAGHRNGEGANRIQVVRMLHFAACLLGLSSGFGVKGLDSHQHSPYQSIPLQPLQTFCTISVRSSLNFVFQLLSYCSSWSLSTVGC